ncbi:right-handed parallel beta-helix repeat-containing protein [Halobacteriales archaeon Cl-PHB]
MGFAGSGAAAEYETITVPAGESRTYRVGDDEVFENKLFDISASGAVVRVIIDGHDATVRNIAWSGTQDAESYAVFAHVGSGDCLIENVYMGDGSSTGESAGQQDPTALWAGSEASGTLTVRGVNVQGWGDNAMYFSSPSDLTTTIENCYVSDNNNAEYRLPDGGTVRNSVVRNGQDRGVWAWGPGTVTVENCHIHAPDASAFWSGEASHTDATIDVSNTEWSGSVTEVYGTVNFRSGNGNSPQDFLPDGCPATAEAAASDTASGGGGGDGSDGSDGTQLSRTLAVETPTNGDLVEYEVVTTGEVALGAEAESPDSVTQNSDGTWTVSGLCGDGATDTFAFEGSVADYAVSGGRAAIVVDGETINPVETSSLRVDTPDNGDLAAYEIVTTGEITPGTNAEDTDQITQNADGTWTVIGVCGDGYADTFEFKGEVSDHSITDGPATIYVDGQEYAAFDPGPSTMRLETPEDGNVVWYDVVTTGEIRPGENAESSDEITQNSDGTWTVSGICGGGYADTFEFEGTVESFDYRGGEATLLVDGSAVRL